MKANSSRQGIIDIWKFLGSIVVMTCHQIAFDFIGNNENPYCELYMIVELFFIITGYYTFLHFEKCANGITLDDKSKNSIIYTINKFKAFAPYVITAIIAQYIIEIFIIGGDYRNTIFAYTPFDLLLLSQIFTESFRTSPIVVPLWFLSSMFIVFPLFCLICQIKSKYTLYIFSFLEVSLYYGYFGIMDVHANPMGLLRTFSGLMLGIVTYALSNELKRINFNKITKITLTIVEQGFLLISIYFMYTHKSLMMLNLLCFAIGFSILFSQQSYTKYIRAKQFDLLGKASMIIFIFHWGIGRCITTFLHTSIKYKIVIYYSFTILFSVLIACMAEKISCVFRSKIWYLFQNHREQ